MFLLTFLAKFSEKLEKYMMMMMMIIDSLKDRLIVNYIGSRGWREREK